MKPLTIKLQVTLASIIAVTLFLIGTLLHYGINEHTHKLENNYIKAINIQLTLKDSLYHIIQIQQFITDAALTHNQDSADKALNHKDKVLELNTKLATIAPNFSHQLQLIKQKTSQLYDSGIEMIDAYTTQNMNAGNQIMDRENTGFDALSSSLTKQINNLMLTATNVAIQSKQQLKAAETSAKNGNLLISIIQIIVLLSISALVFLRIIPTITRLNNNLTQLASGDKDLSRRLTIHKHDELGAIASSINDFTAGLDTIMSTAKQATQRLGKITESFQHGATKASTGMKEVHAHTDMLATAVTEMASTVTEVARNTEHAAQIAANTRETTIAGERVVSESVDIINTLAKDIDESATQIHTLVQLSEKIGNIINVIKTISDQTNLLALNAAIEAARAGDAGRGFAVVADEVRSLAKNTQDSASEIEQMINQIQTASQRVSTSMQNNIDKATITVEKAKQAGDSLKQIASSVVELADVNMQIASASEQQKTVSEEINRSILHVANIATDTLDVANQVSTSSIECAQSAEEVSNLISQFKTTKLAS